MKRRLPILALLVGALSIVSGTAVAAPMRPDACMAHSTALLEALVHADYTGAVAGFDPLLTRLLGAGRLKTAWTGLQEQAGVYVSHAAVQKRFMAGQPVYVAGLVFTRAAVDMVTSCDGRGRIDGLHFVPPARVVASTQESAPSGVQAHVEADGVRVVPLDVSTPVGPLHGALTLPPGRGPFPAVVLVAGSGAHDMDETVGPNKPFRDIAEGLARAGIASLRYDKRTFDYPTRWDAKSGAVIDAEVTDDAVAAARLLARQKAVDPRRVFVLGHSLGAMMAPRIGRRDPRLAGLILMAAPARGIFDVLEQQAREQLAKAGRPPAVIAQTVKGDEREHRLLSAVAPGQAAPPGKFGGVPQAYWLSWSRVDAIADAKKLSMPMLVLQGGADFQVSPTLDFARWKRELAGRPDTTFHLYPGLSHLFMPAGKSGTLADYATRGHVDARVIGDVAAWIKAKPGVAGVR